MLFKIVKCNMPVQDDDILLPADPRTRHHHSFKFKHIQSHTTQYKHSFFVRSVPEWNSLPKVSLRVLACPLEACVNVDTITTFQTQLHYAPWAVCTSPSSCRDTRKWYDDYCTRTRTRTRTHSTVTNRLWPILSWLVDWPITHAQTRS